MNYGFGYQGSKNRIAQKIIDILPPGNRFVDLFCGGCSMTHCAMLSGKYKEFLANDIDGMLPQLFKDAIDGKYKDERRWVSRDDFFRLKDNDPYARICFSFGNNSRTYMYNPQLEPYKRACHYAVVFDEWDEFKRLCPETVDAAMNALDGLPHDDWKQIKERRLKFVQAIVSEMKRLGVNEEHKMKLDRLQRLESLQRLQRLQSLERLERLDGLDTSSISYDQYEYKDGDVVYCDPPYKNTEKYLANIDHDIFWEWVRTRDYPVYVSEYSAPLDFVPIFRCQKSKMMAGGKSASQKATECVFLHQRFA